MDTKLASKMGKAFCLGVLYARRKKLAFDEVKWITVKPNGPQHTGRPALIDNATGQVLGGMGGKFTGRHISAIKQGGKFEQPGAQMQIIALLTVPAFLLLLYSLGVFALVIVYHQPA